MYQLLPLFRESKHAAEELSEHKNCIIRPYEAGITDGVYVGLVFCLLSLCSAKAKHWP